jgi:hypothetical protein
MKTLCLLMIAMTVINLVPVRAYAADANGARVNQLLDRAAASFKQNNFFQGVSQMREACVLLKQDPAAGDISYIDVAAECIKGVEQGIQNMHVSNDLTGMAAVSSRVSALQPLLQSCIEWEPANPRWHYESGRLYRLESAALGDRYPTMLRQAIGEYNRAISMPAGGEYREKAQSELAECTPIVDQRHSEMEQWQRAHPAPASHGHTGLSYVYCANCGARHVLGQACYVCHSSMTKPGVEVDK